MESGLLILFTCVVAFAMIAKRLSSTIITAPMVFLAIGYVFSKLDLLPTMDGEHTLHLVAETALIVLLFLDAAQIDLKDLRANHIWPTRMLVLGLPLAIVLGTATAAFFLPSWPLVALALVAALLAPTDAALGQSVVANPLVPGRVRSALSVESGLNDGLALPAILLFASFSAEMMSSQDQNWLLFGLLQITLGPLVGVAMGYVGGKILILARDRDLTSDTFEGIAALAMAGAIYLAAVHVGGNGFIAAFVAGLTFGNIIQGRCKFIFEFTESEGQMFTWTAFFMLGLVMLPEAINKLTLPILGLILVSLFVVRPLAVWISLIGTGASPLTRIFFGWFGPRGLATALFALLILPDINHQIADSILAIAINAVWISALLHGVSAAPAAIYYARKVSDMGDCEENRPVAPVFSRTED